MHSDSALGYLQRSILYLFRLGNLVYAVALMLALITLTLFARGGALGELGFLLWGTIIAVIIIFMCKLLDGMRRITVGLADDAVPLKLVSHLPKATILSYVMGISIYGCIIFFLQQTMGANRDGSALLQLLIFLLYCISPAVTLSLLQGHGLLSFFNPGNWKRAVLDIGIVRYIIALFIPLVVAAIVSMIYSMLIRPLFLSANALNHFQEEANVFGAISTRMAIGIYIDAVLHSMLRTFLLALPWIYFAWFFPPPEEIIDLEGLEIDDGELAELDMDAALLEQLAQLKAEEEKIAQLQQKQPPVDLSQLNEANTENMSAEEQRNFARDLTQSDIFLRQGENGKAESLLQTYTDVAHPVDSYLPAYKRLYHLYRRQNELEALKALEYRLIEATAKGNPHSYPTVRQTLDNTDSSVWPADWIYPLAQIATTKQHYDTVLTLTKNFVKNHPEHRLIVDNYFLAARALAKKGENIKAQQLLQQLLKRYPQHSKAMQIQRTLELMQQKQKGQM